jgi:hypothetical protein
VYAGNARSSSLFCSSSRLHTRSAWLPRMAASSSSMTARASSISASSSVSTGALCQSHAPWAAPSSTVDVTERGNACRFGLPPRQSNVAAPSSSPVSTVPLAPLPEADEARDGAHRTKLQVVDAGARLRGSRPRLDQHLEHVGAGDEPLLRRDVLEVHAAVREARQRRAVHEQLRATVVDLELRQDDRRLAHGPAVRAYLNATFSARRSLELVDVRRLEQDLRLHLVLLPEERAAERRGADHRLRDDGAAEAELVVFLSTISAPPLSCSPDETDASARVSVQPRSCTSKIGPSLPLHSLSMLMYLPSSSLPHEGLVESRP